MIRCPVNFRLDSSWVYHIVHVCILCASQFGWMCMIIVSDDVQKVESMNWFVNRQINSKVHLTEI